MKRRTLEHGGRERKYYLVMPKIPSGAEKIPLVLALHGGGGTGRQMCRLRGGVQELALAEGFLVACPEGVDHHWNDGRLVYSRRTVQEGVDDVGFLLALVDALKAEFPIDRDRIYVTGVSNGGMMTMRMSCEASATFAAAAAVIAELPVDLNCYPEAPISILLMNGTEDPLVPWDGGQVHLLRQQLGQVYSTQATIDFWLRSNECTQPPNVAPLADADPDDGTLIIRESHPGCAGGSSVVLYRVEGGGHTWPGGVQYAPRFLIGKVSRDAVAGELIWAFFQPLARGKGDPAD
ncbi:MAG: PHB depolymerase family esterase [Anaerolineales bacterium]